MFNRNPRRAAIVACLAAFVAMLAIPGARAAPAAGGTGAGDFDELKYTTESDVVNFSADATTIPYFRSTLTDPTNGATYPYTMVGTDPSQGDVTTIIPTVIIPFRFNFEISADPSVHTLDGTDYVDEVIQSPVFQSADIGAAANATASAPPGPPLSAPGRTVDEPSDVTQLGDAIYRAQWGKTGTGYHVLLGQPIVMPTVSIDVPKNHGQIVIGRVTGSRAGLIDWSWLGSHLLNTLNSLHISPRALPIFLSFKTFFYTPSGGGGIAYHGVKSSRSGNGKQQVNTYIYAPYIEPGMFGINPGDSESFVEDIEPVTHEVQEWYDDPFILNHVTPWSTPITAPFYGCSSLLETGDPVLFYGFKITMPNGVAYHMQDEVHYSWFARERPSRAERGYYSYLNNYADVADGC